MRNMVRKDCRNAQNILTARNITSSSPNMAWVSEIRAIFNFVRQNVRYSLDPVDHELLQGLQNTLAIGSGDCDDMCIALATLLRCVGHPCWFLAVGFGPDVEFTHVITQTSGAGETATISLDATVDEPMGWFPPGVTCSMRCDI